VRRITLLIAALLALPSPVLAQAGEGSAATRVGSAVRPTSALAIDGRLDEASWASASPMSDFVQRFPFDGQPASERTEVRVIADESAAGTNRTSRDWA
jgi:hypothetical protein